MECMALKPHPSPQNSACQPQASDQPVRFQKNSGKLAPPDVTAVSDSDEEGSDGETAKQTNGPKEELYLVSIGMP